MRRRRRRRSNGFSWRGFWRCEWWRRPSGAHSRFIPVRLRRHWCRVSDISPSTDRARRSTDRRAGGLAIGEQVPVGGTTPVLAVIAAGLGPEHLDHAQRLEGGQPPADRTRVYPAVSGEALLGGEGELVRNHGVLGQSIDQRCAVPHVPSDHQRPTRSRPTSDLTAPPLDRYLAAAGGLTMAPSGPVRRRPGKTCSCGGVVGPRRLRLTPAGGWGSGGWGGHDGLTPFLRSTYGHLAADTDQDCGRDEHTNQRLVLATPGGTLYRAKCSTFRIEGRSSRAALLLFRCQTSRLGPAGRVALGSKEPLGPHDKGDPPGRRRLGVR